MTRKVASWAAAVAVVLGLLTVGSMTAKPSLPTPTTVPASPTEDADDDFESELTLRDGRQVHFRLVAKKGVFERHRADSSAKWSSWQTIYRTSTDRCQEIKLAERHGTVAAIADFGLFCYDGEPPEESVAAVGTGDLTKWEHKATRNFDGWKQTTVTGDGARVTFKADTNPGPSTLEWNRGRGFSDAHLPKPELPRIDKYFLGDWKTRDGAHRVTLTEPKPEAGKAVYRTLQGETCKATSLLTPGNGKVFPTAPTRHLQGTKNPSCPPSDQLIFQKGKGGTLILKDSDETVRTYVRSGPFRTRPAVDP